MSERLQEVLDTIAKIERQRRDLADERILLEKEFNREMNEALKATGRAINPQCNTTEYDSTDAACPAWWRGEESGVRGACRVINQVLDTGHAEGFTQEPLQALRVRVLALAIQAGWVWP